MKYTHEQYAQSLYEAFQDTNPKDHDRVIENFIGILKSHGDLSEYERIIAAYEKYDKGERGVKEVEVTTAGSTVNRSLLNELNHLVGINAEIKQKVDENLIGGVVIKVDDTLIDASIKRQLENLDKTLKE